MFWLNDHAIYLFNALIATIVSLENVIPNHYPLLHLRPCLVCEFPCEFTDYIAISPSFPYNFWRSSHFVKEKECRVTNNDLYHLTCKHNSLMTLYRCHNYYLLFCIYVVPLIICAERKISEENGSFFVNAYSKWKSLLNEERYHH